VVEGTAIGQRGLPGPGFAVAASTGTGGGSVRGGGAWRCGTECVAWSGFNKEGESVPAGWRTPGITRGMTSGIGHCACTEEHRDGPQGLVGC
jgi:hypothetical protein